MQQKFLSLDVRIHHRIWDAQKHLLHTLARLKKKTFDNQIIELTIKKTFKSCQTSIKSNLRLQQRFEFATKVPFTRCENSSQNLGCSKTSTSHSCEIEQKDFSQSKNIIDNAAKCLHRVKHLLNRIRDSSRGLNLQQNIFSLDVRFHHRIWDTQKHLLHTLVLLNKKTFDN